MQKSELEDKLGIFCTISPTDPKLLAGEIPSANNDILYNSDI